MSIDITPQDIERAWNSVLKQTDGLDFKGDDIKVFVQEIQYQGLNPARIAHLVLKRGAERPNIKEDIIRMIIFGVERGNKVSSMHNRSTDEATKMIEDLKKTYSIVDTAGKCMNTLTLSRVALAFPHLACEYSAIAFSRTVPTSSLPANFPLHMTHSAFANLIPISNRNVLAELSQMLLLYQVLFSLVVDKDAKKGTHQECKDRCMRFIKAGYNSSYVPESKRVEYLVRWKILVSASELSPETIGASAAVKEQFEAMKMEDESKRR